METKDNTNKINYNFIEDQSLSLKEYKIGNGVGFKPIISSLIFMNGIIFAHRYGFTNDKRFAVLTLVSSIFLGNLLIRKVFGDTKLSELYESDSAGSYSYELLKSNK